MLVQKAFFVIFMTMAFSAIAFSQPTNANISFARYRLVPAWGYRAYTNEEFAWAPSDHGRCSVDSRRRIVYCGVKNGDLLALSTENGKLIWQFSTKGSVRTEPAVTPAAVFIGSSDGCVYKLDPDNGHPLWDKPFCTDAAVWGGPVVRNDVVYFTSTVNKLYAISAGDGVFRWSYSHDLPAFMSAEGVASPSIEGNKVVTGFSDGFLVALDVSTQSYNVAWKTDISGGKKQTDVDTTPVIQDGVVYASSFGEGPSAVRLEDGRVLWRSKWFGASRPVMQNDMLVFGTADGEVVGARLSDGKTIFVTKLAPNSPTWQRTAAWYPVIIKDVIVVASDWGLYALSAHNGAPIELLSMPFGCASLPAIKGHRIFVVGNGGTVDAIDIKPR